MTDLEKKVEDSGIAEKIRVAYYLHNVPKTELHRLIGGTRSVKGQKPSAAATEFLNDCLKTMPIGFENLRNINSSELRTEMQSKHKLSFFVRPGKAGGTSYVALPLDKYIELINNQTD